MVPEIELLVHAGIPVMGHIGFTPQSEHVLGGYRIQGRGDAGDALVEDALALENAGAFAVVMEMVPAAVAARVTEVLHIPTIGIGAGPNCDARCWSGRTWPACAAARCHASSSGMPTCEPPWATPPALRREVAGGTFPTAEHSYH